MIVSWNWLKEYFDLDVSSDELAERLMMSGLNHEGTTEIDGDLAIDLEVTSNRPDCLGHIGVAREAAVLFDAELKIPAAEPSESQPPASELVEVRIDCPLLCRQYTARVIRGVKVGPSPSWLVSRLATLGIESVNNVVDVTNYVLMECGQPLHAFDLATVTGSEIIVREARGGEPFEAINHKTYELAPGMCVIADRRRAVALGGVMGGADTEVSESTKEVLLEAAEFVPTSIRNTARQLNLHSDSSYRFERGVDPQGVDWASRRAAAMILELAGGELAEGVVRAGQPAEPHAPVTLRFEQLPRILGIDIDSERAREILTALGNREIRSDDKIVEVVPPSWRRDLTREIDLVEEIARIHGYEQIPEDVRVPMVSSAKSERDEILDKTRHVMTSAGFDEAVTSSAVEARASDAFSPWTDAPALTCKTPVLRGADRLRRSLVPSLLAARRTNETLSNRRIELFEIANIYLLDADSRPTEQWMLGMTSGGDFLELKGVLESLLAEQHVAGELNARPTDDPLFDPEGSCELWLGEERFGYLGQVSQEGLDRFELRFPTTVAEIMLEVLAKHAVMVPQHVKRPSYPPIERDLNLVVNEAIRWSDVAATVRRCAGESLDALEFKETYRSDQLAAGSKSLLFTFTLRDQKRTLTGAEADQIQSAIVDACLQEHGAKLRA